MVTKKAPAKAAPAKKTPAKTAPAKRSKGIGKPLAIDESTPTRGGNDIVLS